MTFEIKPVTPGFAAEVFDLDLRNPIADDDLAAFIDAMHTYGIVVIHGQHDLPGDAQIAFTERLGPLHLNNGQNVIKPEERRLSFNFADVSNLELGDSIWDRNSRRRMFEMANRLWHSDGIAREIPSKFSVLYGDIIPPEGGNTEFTDMRAAYDALDAEAKAEVEDLVIEVSTMFARGQLGQTDWTAEEKENFKPVHQRLVRYLPETGRKNLFMSSHIGGIVGWPRPEAMAFIRDLTEHATQRQFVYAHRWTQGDLLVWDNRVTMHRGRRFDDQKYKRALRRTITRCEASTLEQQAA